MSIGTQYLIQSAGMIRPLLHDLRSPLASIMALARFASARKPMRESEMLATLADISSAARHLNDLAEVALFVNKTAEERNDVDIAAIDIHELISEIRSELAPHAKAFGVEVLQAVEQQLIYGDTSLVKMLFRFMMKSAIKYSRNDDQIIITGRVMQRAADQRHEVGVAFTPPQLMSPHAVGPDQESRLEAFRGDGFFQLNLTILFGLAVADSHRGDFLVVSEGKRTQLLLSLPASTRSPNITPTRAVPA